MYQVIITYLEDYGHFGEQGVLVEFNQLLNSTDEVFLALRVAVGEPQQQGAVLRDLEAQRMPEHNPSNYSRTREAALTFPFLIASISYTISTIFITFL